MLPENGTVEPGNTTMDIDEQTIRTVHKRTKGKCAASPVEKVTRATYPALISPGAALLAEQIKRGADEREYTARDETVFIISNGSHVHGYGNVGAHAVLPILEAKALLLQQFGGLRAIPLPVALHETSAIVQLAQGLAPGCGAILLDGFSEPVCSEVLAELVHTCEVPVLESTRHGTAVVILAGLINAHRVLKKDLHQSRVAIFGTGPIAVSLVYMLNLYGVSDTVVVDRDGILSPIRTNLEEEKEWLMQVTNKEERVGSALEAVTGANVVVSLSKAGALREEYIRMMAQHAVVFALREPEPELSPQDIRNAGAEIVATKSFAYQNYVTDALVLPHVLKAVITQGIQTLSDRQCLKVAQTLAETVPKPTRNKILPTVFDRRIAGKIMKLFK